MTENAKIKAAAARVVERTVELCQIPAPPLDEGERAARVMQWWQADGLREVELDHVGNVWASLRGGDGPAVVVAAHLDTVFSREVTHGVTEVDGRLVGPGVGDDSVAVAALSALEKFLPQALPWPVRLVATVGEEGLGNLLGVTTALADPLRPTRALIALEGNYLGRVNTIGVGSHRIRVHLTGPGGHAWEEATNPSAVHAGGAIVAALDGIRRPEGRTSLNVGTVSGGESINARAQHLELVVDLRAESQAALDDLVSSAREAISRCADSGRVDCTVEIIGRRPAGRIAEDHPLVQAAVAGLVSVAEEARFTAASTDANAAYACDIPALTLGITTGELTHTENEWIDIEPIGRGLAALAATIINYATSEEP